MQLRKADVGNIAGSIPGQHVPTGDEHADLDRILNVKAPMPVMGGPDPVPTDSAIMRTRVSDDAELLKRTEHVRRPKEVMMQFYARTGLGKSQILTMTKDEISKFVEIAEQSAKDTAQVNVRDFEPKRVPPRFVLT